MPCQYTPLYQEIRTGKERMLVFDVSWDCHVEYQKPDDDPTVPPVVLVNGAASITAFGLIASFRADASWRREGNEWINGFSMRAAISTGDGQFTYGSWNWRLDSGGKHDHLQRTLHGRIQMEMDVLQLAKYRIFPSGLINPATGRPAWSGAPEAIPALWLDMVETYALGANRRPEEARCVITLEDEVFPLTIPDPYGPPAIVPDYRSFLAVTIGGYGSPEASHKVSHLHGTFSGAPLTYPYTSPTGRFSTVAGPKTRYWDGRQFNVWETMLLSPEITYDINGIVRTLAGDAYPDPLNVKFQAGDLIIRDVPVSGGAFSDSVTQRDVVINCLEYPYLIQEQTKYPVHAYFDNNSLLAMDEAVADTRLLATGKMWPAIRLSHAPSTIIDHRDTALRWQPVEHAQITVDGDLVTIKAVGGVGSAKRAYIPPTVTAGYRYALVKIRITGANNQTVQLRIGGNKSWTLVGGSDGVQVTREIDLMAPDSASGNLPIDVDTRWPVKDLAGNVPETEGRLTGIHHFDQIEILGIPEGKSVEIDEAITFVRKRRVRGSIASTFGKFVMEWIPIQQGFFDSAKRFLIADVDGRVALEIKDLTLGSPGGMYVEDTICHLIQSVQKITGLTADDLTPGGGVGTYFNNGLPAFFLGGAGYTYEGGAWKSWLDFDIAAGGSVTIPAQMLIDRISVHPGCQDLSSDEGYGTYGNIALHMAKVFRAGGHGLAVDQAYEPNPDAVVELYTDPYNVLIGSGIADEGGYFRTDKSGMALAKGIHYAKTVVDGRTLSGFLTAPRHWHKGSGRSFTADDGVTIATGRIGYLIGYSDDEGVKVDRAWDGQLPLVDTFFVSQDEGCAEPRLCYVSDHNVFTMTWMKGTDAYRAFTLSEGASWIPVPGLGVPFQTMAKHFREVYNERTQEYVHLWIDEESGELMWSITSALTEKEVYRSSVGIGHAGTPLIVDDSSFDAEFVNGASQYIDVVFTSGGARDRYRTIDEARSWLHAPVT